MNLPHNTKDYRDLKNENYCLRTVINSINEGVMVVDNTGSVCLYNNQMQDFEGLSSKNLIGKHITEIYDVDKEDSEHLTVQRTNNPIIDRYQRYNILDKQSINLIASTYPIIKEGKTIATYSISRNLTTVSALLEKTRSIQRDNENPALGGLSKNSLDNNTRYVLGDVIGENKEIQDAIYKAKMASQFQSPILIYGETGTGKELFVQGIHNENPRTKDNPFIALNCAAIPESLLESLLFGTTKGAFTGSMDSYGLIVQAGMGTLFLDEINSMPLNLQAKLLRVLQEKKYRRLGGKKELPLQCRIISSTNIDPLMCIKNSSLRSDLYYRLAVISINIPPLRERADDILKLANHFIRNFAKKYDKSPLTISKDVESILYSYNWPGNVRELEHTMEYAITMSATDTLLTKKHLPSTLVSHNSFMREYVKAEPLSLKQALLNTESETIIKALDHHDWNISKSAESLGIARQNLQYRIKKLGLKKGSSHLR